MKISGEMQVDIGHGNHLGIASPASAPLHPETGPHTRLPKSGHSLLPDLIQCIHQTDEGRRLPFSGRGWGHGCHQNQLALGFAREWRE